MSTRSYFRTQFNSRDGHITCTLSTRGPAYKPTPEQEKAFKAYKANEFNADFTKFDCQLDDLKRPPK